MHPTLASISFSSLAIDFSLTDSFKAGFPMSDINFEADILFR
tara:strand:- start:366 stop:491 length:126 start_codon:yes stop_codon:yes gene_type:complete